MTPTIFDFNTDPDAFKRNKNSSSSSNSKPFQAPTGVGEKTTDFMNHPMRVCNKLEETCGPRSNERVQSEASALDDKSTGLLRQTLCSQLIDNYKLKSNNIQNVEVFSVRGGVSELKSNKNMGSGGKMELLGGKYDFPGGKYDFPISKTVKLEKSIITSVGDKSVEQLQSTNLSKRALSDKKSDILERKNFENSTSSFNVVKDSTNMSTTSRLDLSTNPNLYYSNQNQSADKNSTVQDLIYSIKDISNGFSTYFKKKLKTFTDRLGCSCDAKLKNKETCSRAHTWLAWKYNTSEHEYLKKVYDSLKDAKPDEKSRIQIKKDINRTFPSHEFFKEKSEG